MAAKDFIHVALPALVITGAGHASERVLVPKVPLLQYLLLKQALQGVHAEQRRCAVTLHAYGWF